MNILGNCHCGNISFELVWNPDPQEIPARACDCTFCRKHGGVWTSNPAGALTVQMHGIIRSYVPATLPLGYMTPAEVAVLFRVDPKTVTRWAQAGKLTSIRTLGGHRRYPLAEVERLLNAGRQERGQ